MGRLDNFLWSLFKLSLPLTVIVYPVVAVVGSLGVWPPAREVLASFPKDTPILVGFGYKGTGEERMVSRSYVLLPSVLHDPVVVTIKKVGESAPVVTKSLGSLVFVLVVYLSSIIGTWWLWLRRSVTQPRAPADAPRAARL